MHAGTKGSGQRAVRSRGASRGAGARTWHAQLVEGVLEHVLAAHVDAQAARVARAGRRARARPEERALVVEVDQARRAQQRRKRPLQQRRVRVHQ